MHARKNFSPALALKSWRGSFHFCAAWAPRAPNLNVAPAGASPGPPTPPGRGASLFPAKREVKRELSKAWQAWPGNQTSSRCLVRSLVLLGGERTTPMVQGGARWSLGRARPGSTARLAGPGAGPGRPAQGDMPRKIGVKKSRPKFPWRRAYAKSAQSMISELAVGVKKFCRRP